MKVKAYEGLPVEAEGAEDPEMVAALLGEIGNIMKRLGIKAVRIEGDFVVGEG